LIPRHPYHRLTLLTPYQLSLHLWRC